MLLDADGDTLIDAANADRDPAIQTDLASQLASLRVSRTHGTGSYRRRGAQRAAQTGAGDRAGSARCAGGRRAEARGRAARCAQLRGGSAVRAQRGHRHARADPQRPGPRLYRGRFDVAARPGRLRRRGNRQRALARPGQRMADRFRIVLEAGQLFSAATSSAPAARRDRAAVERSRRRGLRDPAGERARLALAARARRRSTTRTRSSRS